MSSDLFEIPPASPPETALEKLAEAAHEMWCACMIEAGWSPGPVVDERAMRHDALVPFRQLSHDDRWTAIESVAALCLESQLIEAIRYPRGALRPLTTREMLEGLRVESTLDPVVPGDPPARGRVVGWGAEAKSGRLEWIRVLWDDGTLVTHSPLECEFRKVGEA